MFLWLFQSCHCAYIKQGAEPSTDGGVSWMTSAIYWWNKLKAGTSTHTQASEEGPCKQADDRCSDWKARSVGEEHDKGWTRTGWMMKRCEQVCRQGRVAAGLIRDVWTTEELGGAGLKGESGAGRKKKKRVHSFSKFKSFIGDEPCMRHWQWNGAVMHLTVQLVKKQIKKLACNIKI